ncbi:GNAT family N-acetyltransferase [Filobacillus milosensis]|nr:GNAT family protein [Filobacillus milosensis]
MKQPIKFLEGEKVYLRPIEEDDFEAIYSGLWDPDVRRLTGTKQIFTRSMVKNFLEKSALDSSRVGLIICAQQTDEMIGELSLNEINHQDRNASFRIALSTEAHTGKGHGSEAIQLMLAYGFRQLNLHRIELEVFAFNERAKHVYERLGFQQEGVRRDALFYDGEYHDAIVMGILENEFFKV